MPLIWEDNPVFLEHSGVIIYHIYKDDSYDAGLRQFWYALTPYGSDQGSGEGGEFDVRDLVSATGVDFGTWADEDLIRATIIAAIESGELRWPQDDEEDDDGQG